MCKSSQKLLSDNSEMNAHTDRNEETWLKIVASWASCWVVSMAVRTAMYFMLFPSCNNKQHRSPLEGQGPHISDVGGGTVCRLCFAALASATCYGILKSCTLISASSIFIHSCSLQYDIIEALKDISRINLASD